MAYHNTVKAGCLLNEEGDKDDEDDDDNNVNLITIVFISGQDVELQ